jgi:5-methylthioadenosine/S-adenosylhomocysteine deaminase
LYTNSEQTLRLSRALADKYGVPVVIHLSETQKENRDMEAKYGGSPASVLDRWGILSGRTIAAHGVWVSAADMEILRKRGTGVAHCPSSNMKLASGIAPVVQYLRSGVSIGLGTDGPAGSNNDLDLLEEMDLAAKLQKVHTSDPTVVSAQEAFEMATIRGAHAIGMANDIGSIDAGKRADLTFLRFTDAHAQPLFNVYSQLVYALKGSDVRHVVVNGRVVVKDRRVLTLNEAEVLKAAAAWKGRISESVATPRP